MWATGVTVASLLFYRSFMFKHWRFYNFYRKPTRFRMTYYLKCGASQVTLLSAWFYAFNEMYKKKLTADITDVGLFDRYRLETKSKPDPPKK